MFRNIFYPPRWSPYVESRRFVDVRVVHLPLVFGAVTTAESVVLGVLKSVQDGLVLAVEGNTRKQKKKVHEGGRRRRYIAKHGLMMEFHNILKEDEEEGEEKGMLKHFFFLLLLLSIRL